MRLPDLELRETCLTYPLLLVVETPERRGGVQWNRRWIIAMLPRVGTVRCVSSTAQYCPGHVFIPAGLRCPVWLAVHLLLD